MRIGILESDARAWEGNAFFADDSAEAEGRRKDLLAPSAGDGVFCRTAPADKQRIIKLLADAHGDVTAGVEIKLLRRVVLHAVRLPLRVLRAQLLEQRVNPPGVGLVGAARGGVARGAAEPG